jgi:hypothetical protein
VSELNSASSGDDAGRRSGQERRNHEDDAKWVEQRSTDDRRGGEDRRGIFYTIRYTNPGAIEKLREWLDENCAGGFEVGVPDIEQVKKWGNYRVTFDEAKDRQKLVRLLGVHWPKWMG